jgi:hypothetical protein
MSTEKIVLTDDQVDELTSFLQGTCYSFSDAVQEILGIDAEDISEGSLSLIDQEVMECECCGWWVERSEEGEIDGHCEDCSSDDIIEDDIIYADDDDEDDDEYCDDCGEYIEDCECFYEEDEE